MSELKVGEKYNPGEIEKKWIDVWEEEQIYVTPNRTNKPKSYVLGMFPYPSGEGLHTGHGRVFTAVDVIARYQQMKGYEVLMPVGWDAFGLPAENAAIKAHKNPVDMVPHNEANFKRQMVSLGLSYDWNRAFSTTDPAYYKWTQWLFLKLYSIKNDKGERLVYRKEVPINWCPFCKTGLANEEVQADGTHERCGTKVTQKLLPQWNMRITDYADRLLADLDTIWKDEDGKEHVGLDWPEGILAQQRNWIGKKEGVKIRFKHLRNQGIKVFDNNYSNLYYSINKVTDLTKLSLDEFPLPNTFHTKSFDEFDTLASEIGYPVIIKPIRTGKGKGVEKIDHSSQLQQFIKQAVEDGYSASRYLIQEFIPYEKDLRVLIIGEHIYAMRRFPKTGDFRANFSLGGSVEIITPDEETKALARKALDCIGLSIGGVDILITPDNKHYVLEVNHNPGIEGIESVTGENIAKTYLEHAIDEVK